MFWHGGEEVQRQVMRDQVADFNESQTAITVKEIEIPGGSGTAYNDAINAAAVANNLPCVVDLDGPYTSNYAWAGYLEPLDQYVPADLKADILPSIIDQGTYEGKLYSIGREETGIALAGRRSLLEKAGLRIPEGLSDAWSLEEFDAAVQKLSTIGGGVEYAIDMKMNYGNGEWMTYAFSPIIQSFGGDLIDRSTYRTAEGVLNGPESVRAMTWAQGLFTNKHSNVTPPDDNEFINGKAALMWAPFWATPVMRETFGSDLVFMPLPDFGHGTKTAMGGWAWGISSTCPHKDAAWEFI